MEMRDHEQLRAEEERAMRAAMPDDRERMVEPREMPEYVWERPLEDKEKVLYTDGGGLGFFGSGKGGAPGWRSPDVDDRERLPEAERPRPFLGGFFSSEHDDEPLFGGPQPVRGPVGEMSDHELLMELVRDKRRRDNARYVKYAVWAVIIIAIAVIAAVYVPKIVSAYQKVMDTYQKVQTVYEQVEDAYGKVNELTIQAQETMDNINDTLKNKLEPAIEGYNDLRDSAADKLQEVSETIGRVTETLRNLFTFR